MRADELRIFLLHYLGLNLWLLCVIHLEGIRKAHLKLKFEKKKIIWNHYDDGREKTGMDWVVVLSLWQVNYELRAIYLISECWFHLQKWRWQVWSVAFKLCSVDVCELWWDIWRYSSSPTFVPSRDSRLLSAFYSKALNKFYFWTRLIA